MGRRKLRIGRINNKTRRRGGWIFVEMVIALVVLGILIGGLAVTQYSIRQFNAIQLLRQRCIAAGQAQLESLAATGATIPAAEIGRLWPGVDVRVEQSPGEGPATARSAVTSDWAGLTLAKVTVVGKWRDREVKIQLARYISGKGGQK